MEAPWISNRGQIVLTYGKLQNQTMVLGGTGHSPTGQRLVPGLWIPEKNGLCEAAGRSSDGGKILGALFDLFFRPHVSPR
jgi:hypothetical protein